MRRYQDSTHNIAVRAAATRKARQANQPTSDQRAAFNKYLSGVGVQAMTADECAHLGYHPGLTASQRQEWIGRAFAKGWR